jgi:hypothetical protein
MAGWCQVVIFLVGLVLVRNTATVSSSFLPSSSPSQLVNRNRESTLYVSGLFGEQAAADRKKPKRPKNSPTGEVCFFRHLFLLVRFDFLLTHPCLARPNVSCVSFMLTVLASLY